MKKLTAAVVLALATVSARADVIQLKDGTLLEGTVKRGPAGYVVTKAGGEVQVVALDQVKAIEVAAPPPLTPDAAKQKLASLRRSVEHMDDVHKIIVRYEQFIEQNANTALEPAAREDLAAWHDRRDRGLVKFGAKWIRPEERAAMQERALAQAGAARRALRENKFAEAESQLNAALAEDPSNAAALYLRGLLQFRQDQVAPARRSFERVNVLVPNHPPTLNNLAVILARQNQNPAALNTFDQAMQAAPRTREILNNVAELMYGLPDDVRESNLAQRVLRRFTEQDEDLVRELQPQGLHRWGATWVTTEQLGQLREAEREAKDKLDQLAAEFDGVKVRMTNIDREIEENERALRRLETSAYMRDRSGQIVQTALPPLYGELQEDNRKLQRERQDQFARLDRLREQAKAVNRNLPVPKYSGILRLMDEAHAPVIAPASPATAPAATSPAPAG